VTATTPTRPELPPPPPNIARLRVDKRGYPVPWFVAWVNGEPEFRAMDPEKIVTAVKQQRCWVCGQRRYGAGAFVIGPMCIVNRTSAEPPSHPECAEYSVRACPFLTKPQMTRREGGFAAPTCQPAGVMIERNPGVSCVWVTPSFVVERVGKGNLFQLGDPIAWSWWAEGRTATRAEVLASIESGLPTIAAIIPADDHRQQAEFRQARQVALGYVPDA
jgi:hypothetical protein